MTYRIPTQHPDFPAFEDAFAQAFNTPASPERKILATYGVHAKDISGQFFEAWRHLAMNWKPGRAEPRAAIGARFSKLMKNDFGIKRRLVKGVWVSVEQTKDGNIDALADVTCEYIGIEKWRVIDSPEVDRLLAGLGGEGKAERTARRHRARQIERMALVGDLFVGEMV